MGGGPDRCSPGGGLNPASVLITFVGAEEGQEAAEPERIEINGVPAVRYDFETPYPGGPSGYQQATQVEFPNRGEVSLLIMNTPPRLTDEIVASIRFVKRNHIGCRTRIPDWRPIPMRRLRPAAATIPANPRRALVCGYNAQFHSASAVFHRALARELAANINAAEPGWGPPRPSCTPLRKGYDGDFYTPRFDILLTYPGRRTAHVIAQKDGCDNFGVQHGSTVSHFTQAINGTLSDPFDVHIQPVGENQQLPVR